MIQIDLSGEEVALLVDVLETCISDIRMEIADTDSKDYREELKQRKEVLKKILAAATE
ncbi:MAG: hypothetical protein ACP5G0_04650 [Desulfomonilia bacterium]